VSPTTRTIDGRVRGDAQQPGGETTAAIFIPPDRGQRALEGLRGQVFGLLLGAAVRPAKRVDAADVEAVELGEGGAVVARSRNERIVGFGQLDPRTATLHAYPYLRYP